MKSSSTTSNIRPYNSKQLLFEEEQKKRAAKRDSVLGNLQSSGAAAPQSSAAQAKPAAQGGIVQTKPASLVSSGKQNSGGIIQMKPNAFSPNARTANTAAGMVKSDNSSTVRTQSTGSTGNLQKPRRTPNMTRGEAWGMLENERKDKRSFSVPSGFSEQGKDVFMQLMELPDWGLDGSESKKDEKVVELKRSVPDTSADVKKEAPLSKLTAYGNLGTESKREPTSVQEQSTLDNERLNNEDRFLSGLSAVASEQVPTLSKLLNSLVNYWENKQNDYTGGYITDQSKFEGSELRYGFDKIARVGCEIISVYNLLLDLEKSPSLAEVALWFQLTGSQMMGGFLGNNPYYIDRVLSHYNIPNTKYYSAVQLQQDVEPGDTMVISYCWRNSLGIPQYHTYFLKATAYSEKPLFAY
ncbi:MAG: hypothetical protein IJP01_05350, partial [Oscillospiraceae bacterium]|nr:hypothetical protein [Oscillospiraceae bacterium]